VKIVKITISRNFKMKKSIILPDKLQGVIPQRTGRQAVIAAVRNLMQPFVDSSFEVRGKTCKVLVAMAKDNNSISINVQERSKDNVSYTEHVCEVKIKNLAGDYDFIPNPDSDHLFITYELLHPAAGLLKYGNEHIFESDIRAALQKLMDKCAVRIFRGAFLFNNGSQEYHDLVHKYIPLISVALQNGSVKVTAIAVQNDQENREEVCIAIAYNVQEELVSLLERMEMPGPNYKRLEHDLSDIEAKVHMADDMINSSSDTVWNMCEHLFDSNYKGLEALYLAKKSKEKK